MTDSNHIIIKGNVGLLIHILWPAWETVEIKLLRGEPYIIHFKGNESSSSECLYP